MNPLRISKRWLSATCAAIAAFSLAGCGTVPAATSTVPQAAISEGAPSANTAVPMASGGPFARVFNPANLPSAADTVGFPSSWTHAYANSDHNAAFSVGSNAPSWLRQGVSWAFPEARAWPLTNSNAFDTSVYGARTALPTITQFYGNSAGVTAIGGVIYAESDDSFAYAINAKTGKLIWRYSPVGNQLMGDPVVSNGVVYLSAGGVGFNFAQVQRYAKHKPAIRGGAMSFNGVYALDAKTGKLLWHHGTKGEAMATPAVKYGRVYFATGSGDIYAISAKTGQTVWETKAGGIDNMSSATVVGHRMYVALSVPGYLYCLNADTGKILWKVTEPGVANTGMGDVSPGVSNGIVVMDAVADPRTVNGKATMNTDVFAVNATTGKVLWFHKMGRGPKPPAFKGGVPLTHNGVAYIGTPVNSIYQAFDLKTGKVLWTWHVPDAGPAGAGRGAATYYQGALYVSTGPYVYALNPTNAAILGKEKLGGRFGIVDPVIVGGTIYLGNSWDWVIATPVSKVNPNYKG